MSDSREVTCELNISPKCKKIYFIKIEENSGKFTCFDCRSFIRGKNAGLSGRKYFYNSDMFENIDTKEKAWILGWVASDGHLSKDSNSLQFRIQKRDVGVIEKILDLVCVGEIRPPIKTSVCEPEFIGKRQDMVLVRICDPKIVKDMKKHLGIPLDVGAKDFVVQFPNLATDGLKWAFIRGVFEGDGCATNVLTSRRTISVEISSASESMKKGIQSSFGKRTDKEINSRGIRWNGMNSIEFLDRIYRDSDGLRLERKYNNYLEWKQLILSGDYEPSYGFKTRSYSLIGPDNSIHIGNNVTKFVKEDKILSKNIKSSSDGLRRVLDKEQNSYKGFSLATIEENK